MMKRSPPRLFDKHRLGTGPTSSPRDSNRSSPRSQPARFDDGRRSQTVNNRTPLAKKPPPPQHRRNHSNQERSTSRHSSSGGRPQPSPQQPRARERSRHHQRSSTDRGRPISRDIDGSRNSKKTPVPTISAYKRRRSGSIIGATPAKLPKVKCEEEEEDKVDMLKVAWTTVLPAGPGKNNHEKPQEEEDRGEDKPSDDVPKIGLDRFSSAALLQRTGVSPRLLPIEVKDQIKISCPDSELLGDETGSVNLSITRTNANAIHEMCDLTGINRINSYAHDDLCIKLNTDDVVIESNVDDFGFQPPEIIHSDLYQQTVMPHQHEDNVVTIEHAVTLETVAVP